MLEDHGTMLMVLKPSSLVQAAQADMRRRARNAETAKTLGTQSYEPFAFHRTHVRKAVDAEDLLVRALMEPGLGRASGKYNTRLIYSNGELLLKAIHLVRERSKALSELAEMDGQAL
jgi:hypothetical protein